MNNLDGQMFNLDSLREKIGVVPRLSASDKEVHDACKAAAIHDKIMCFPDGYDSKVGDRGM
jgi:ABC-type multidrug transport system fused ATPase/permease subunit